MSLPVNTTIIGVDNVAQKEENVKLASEFSTFSEVEMVELEFRTFPIVSRDYISDLGKWEPDGIITAFEIHYVDILEKQGLKKLHVLII